MYINGSFNISITIFQMRKLKRRMIRNLTQVTRSVMGERARTGLNAHEASTVLCYVTHHTTRVYVVCSNKWRCGEGKSIHIYYVSFTR